MTAPTNLRLQRLLGGDHLAGLRRRLRRRFERARPGVPVEHIRLGGLSAEEHATLASLLGRPQRLSHSLGIDVRAVNTALQQAGIAASLRDALEQLDGAIVDLAADRLRARTRWSAVLEGCSHPELVRLLRAPASVGLLKRLTRQDPAAAAEVCRRAEAVLYRLPANGIARAQLAAEVLGDAHALDDGQALATIVLAAWRRPTTSPADKDEDTPTATAGEGDPQQAAERARDIWAAAGVLVNELARPVLFLNLPVKEAKGRASGEPVHASLRSLLRAPPSWDVSGRTVHVCENPNLVAIAADRVGAACSPLVCTEGMPAAAQRCLLSQLASAGAHIRYHGDFDWPGLRIANHVMREHGAHPWRFTSDDYLAAIRIAPPRGQVLEGKAVEASWDRELTATMQQHRLAVAEEALAAVLLEDLRSR